jgi:hypothetical protein
MAAPERFIPSLGGQVGCWIQAHCAIPDGEHRGKPFLLTGEQWAILLNYYALDPKGNWLYPRGGMIVRPQKWGKGPFSAGMIAAEASGPTRFAGWDSSGEPIGRPHPTPLIQVAAVSEDQTANVWDALLPMLQFGEIAHEVDDIGLTRINLPGGGKIEYVTAAHRSRVGQRVTFAVLDELGFWLPGNHGHELADAILRNLAGMNSRFLGLTNAWALEERSVAERIAAEDGVYVADVEPGTGSIRNKADRRKMLRRVYGDSAAGCEAQGNGTGRIEPWINLDRIDTEITSLLQRDEPQADRFFLNRKRAEKASAFDVARFRELSNPDYKPTEGGLIVLGVDGARFEDSLGVVATEVETGFQWVVALEEKPKDADDDYEHDFDKVDGSVVEVCELFDVRRIYIDPHWIDNLAERWLERWGKRVLAWYTNRPRQVGHAVRRWSEAFAGDLSHDGNERFIAHVKNAIRNPVNARDDEGRRLWTIGKDGRHWGNWIDLDMAGIISWEARRDSKEAGEKVRGPYRTAGFG